MGMMDWEMFPEKGRVLGRVVAVGCCPYCGPAVSVTISQAVVAWNDEAETDPAEYSPLQMECGRCGAGIEDVEFPLDEMKWQLLLGHAKPARNAKVVSMPMTKAAR